MGTVVVICAGFVDEVGGVWVLSGVLRGWLYLRLVEEVDYVEGKKGCG